MKTFLKLTIILILFASNVSAQELTKKQIKAISDSISFETLKQITDLKQFTFYAIEQEFIGSSIKLTRNEHYLTILGDSLYVFMPFPNSFDPVLITDTRNLELSGIAEDYSSNINLKQKRISIIFHYKYLATTWEFYLSVEKDKSSSLIIKTEQGAMIKFIGELTEIENEE